MRALSRLLLVLSFFATPLLAQDNPNNVHHSTTPPPSARFEIVQSELAAKWTFKLDRFAGQIFQLVKTKEDVYSWEKMDVIGLPSVAQATRPRFQLFTSGLAAKFTFLIDTDTGKTWQLATAKERLADGTEQETNFWAPLAD